MGISSRRLFLLGLLIVARSLLVAPGSLVSTPVGATTPRHNIVIIVIVVVRDGVIGWRATCASQRTLLSCCGGGGGFCLSPRTTIAGRYVAGQRLIVFRVGVFILIFVALRARASISALIGSSSLLFLMILVVRIRLASATTQTPCNHVARTVAVRGRGGSPVIGYG